MFTKVSYSCESIWCSQTQWRRAPLDLFKCPRVRHFRRADLNYVEVLTPFRLQNFIGFEFKPTQYCAINLIDKSGDHVGCVSSGIGNEWDHSGS